MENMCRNEGFFLRFPILKMQVVILVVNWNPGWEVAGKIYPYFIFQNHKTMKHEGFNPEKYG